MSSLQAHYRQIVSAARHPGQFRDYLIIKPAGFKFNLAADSGEDYLI
jgi:hypothetical protein